MVDVTCAPARLTEDSNCCHLFSLDNPDPTKEIVNRFYALLMGLFDGFFLLASFLMMLQVTFPRQRFIKGLGDHIQLVGFLCLCSDPSSYLYVWDICPQTNSTDTAIKNIEGCSSPKGENQAYLGHLKFSQTRYAKCITNKLSRQFVREVLGRNLLGCQIRRTTENNCSCRSHFNGQKLFPLDLLA